MGGSASEPDLRRRKSRRGSKKVKKGALGPRDGALPRNNSDPTPTFSAPDLGIGGVSGRSMAIGERPASAKQLLSTEQASVVMAELAEVKRQIEDERAALSDQQASFNLERTKLLSRLSEAVKVCPAQEVPMDAGVPGAWSELHAVANALVVGVTTLTNAVEAKDAQIVGLEGVHTKQGKQLSRKKEEHASAMRCLQKFAVNNRLLGQMMEATEAELQAVTEKTAEAAAAAEASFDQSAAAEEQGGSSEDDGGSSGQQGLLEVLVSRLEDAELLSRKRLEASAAR